MSTVAPIQESLQALGNCVRALYPYRADAVLTGGLVPWAYRQMPEVGGPTTLAPLRTLDLDWTVRNRLEPSGELVHDRLRDAGFVELLQGERQPPIARYQPERYGQSLAPIYVEFLTPRRGGYEVRGKDRSVVRVQSGLSAQALPYLDLLFYEPLPFDLALVPETGVEPGTTILVPNPASFILQKTLARGGRATEKKAGDQAHIYDVVLMTRSQWPCWATTLEAMRDSGIYPKAWFKRARTTLAELYASPIADGPIEVARVFNGFMGVDAVKEHTVHRLMNDFLTRITCGVQTPTT